MATVTMQRKQEYSRVSRTYEMMTAAAAARMPNLATAMEAATSGVLMRERDDSLNAVFVSSRDIPKNITDVLKSKPYIYAHMDPATGLTEISKEQYKKTRCENSMFIHKSVLDCMDNGMPLVLSMELKMSRRPLHYVLAADYLNISKYHAAELTDGPSFAPATSSPSRDAITHFRRG